MTEPIKLYAAEAARRGGVSLSTWYNYCSPKPSRLRIAPERDGFDLDRGHVRDYWYPETVDAWKNNRLGQGRRRDLPPRNALSPTDPEPPRTR